MVSVMHDQMWSEALQEIIEMFEDSTAEECLDILLEYALNMPAEYRGTDAELWARVKKAQEAWFVRGVDLPFITTPIRERATESIDTFLSLTRQHLAEKF